MVLDYSSMTLWAKSIPTPSTPPVPLAPGSLLESHSVGSPQGGRRWLSLLSVPLPAALSQATS